MTTRWTRKDLLGLRELTADEINFVLETTDAFKQVGTREIKKVPALRGKTLVNFFVEPSTRTRTSFELAAFRLSEQDPLCAASRFEQLATELPDDPVPRITAERLRSDRS